MDENQINNEAEMNERLKKEINKKTRKRLIYGSLSIIFCFAMVIGLLSGISAADDRTRKIVLISIGSFLGAALLTFILVVSIKAHIEKKSLDLEYVEQKKKKLQAHKNKRKSKK